MPPKKKTKKLQNKSRVKNKASNKTNIKITIDNSRKTQARKTADNKPKGHLNIPINYFPQFTPARQVITDMPPNQGFNTVNLEKLNNEYQTQFKNYFDGRLSEFEKKLLEESEKKNTAPPRPEMTGAFHNYTDYNGETFYEEPIGKAQSTNITEQKPPSQSQSTNITGLDILPLAEVEEFDEDKVIKYGKEAQQIKDAEQMEKLRTQAIELQKYIRENNPYYKGSDKTFENFSIGQLEGYIKKNTRPLDYYLKKQKEFYEKQNKQPGQKGRPKKNKN